MDNPRLEARLLLAHLRNGVGRVDPAALDVLINRRVAHEPLALILGKREFWSLDFAVSPATLIPRPDSETLIEVAVAEFADRAPPSRILDLGTGTGCLLLAALSEFGSAFGVGVDRCPAAACLAADNAATLGMADRAAFLCGDWATALAGRFDLVLCNPPYIPTSEIGDLMPDVANYEPRTALDGGADGLSAYRCLIPDLHRLLTPGGFAALELGAGQAAAVEGLARADGFRTGFRQDLAKIDRVLLLREGPS